MLDIPGRGTLFALLRGPNNAELMKYLAGNTFAKRLPDRATNREWYSAFSKLEGVAELPSKSYPLLVTFTDIKDPKTVRRVDPEDLAASFGPGVSLERVMLEITNERVTEGRVENKLPCLHLGKACISLNRNLPYGHPMSNILNSAFWSK